jgi:hypothetical protein
MCLTQRHLGLRHYAEPFPLEYVYSWLRLRRDHFNTRRWLAILRLMGSDIVQAPEQELMVERYLQS